MPLSDDSTGNLLQQVLSCFQTLLPASVYTGQLETCVQNPSVSLTPALHLPIQLFSTVLDITYLSRALKSSRPEYFVFTSAPPRLVFPRPPPTRNRDDR